MRVTEKFQSNLEALGISQSAGNSGGVETLMDRFNNINTKFANIRSQEILCHTYHLMMTDLSQCMRVSAECLMRSERGVVG